MTFIKWCIRVYFKYFRVFLMYFPCNVPSNFLLLLCTLAFVCVFYFKLQKFIQTWAEPFYLYLL